jgi:hypothetical protein
MEKRNSETLQPQLEVPSLNKRRVLRLPLLMYCTLVRSNYLFSSPMREVKSTDGTITFNNGTSSQGISTGSRNLERVAPLHQLYVPWPATPVLHTLELELWHLCTLINPASARVHLTTPRAASCRVSPAAAKPYHHCVEMIGSTRMLLSAQSC